VSEKSEPINDKQPCTSKTDRGEGNFKALGTRNDGGENRGITKIQKNFDERESKNPAIPRGQPNEGKRLFRDEEGK